MMTTPTALSGDASSPDLEDNNDTNLDGSRVLLLEVDEISRWNSKAMHLNNCSDHIPAEGVDYPDQTGRLNSVVLNAASNSMGLGPEDLNRDFLHHNMQDTFDAERFFGGKEQSCQIDGVMRDTFSPSDLGHSEISDEIKDLFQYVDAYKVQEVEIGTILKPFIPDYILAVGAIDEFIKVPRPDNQPDHLGLKVLDESGARQSDPAILTLQLRAASNKPSLHLLEVASIENAEKNPKKLDAWINTIKDLHRSKPPPCVIYSEEMPEVDKLMQEWPSEIEKVLAEIQLPGVKLDVDLATFVDFCCSILDIPVYKSRVESLHVMFSLYWELKNHAN